MSYLYDSRPGAGSLFVASILPAIVFAIRWTIAVAASRPKGGGIVIGGVGLGVAALLLVDLPATITQVALDRDEGREHIRAANGAVYSDVPSWYWSALTGGSVGPWLAVMTVERTS